MGRQCWRGEPAEGTDGKAGQAFPTKPLRTALVWVTVWRARHQPRWVGLPPALLLQGQEERELSKGCNFWRARFAPPPPAAFFCPSSSRPLPRRWGKREDGGSDGEGVGLPLLFSALLFFFFWGLWRCLGAVLVLAALHPCCRSSLPLAVCGR